MIVAKCVSKAYTLTWVGYNEDGGDRDGDDVSIQYKKMLFIAQ